MQMPRPTSQHARLEGLAGTWKGSETIHPMAWSPEGSTADGVMEARMGCGGLFLISDYRQLQGGQATFTGHGVYGWDEAGACYVMNWFDSMTPGGSCRPVRGKWEGDTLTFESEAPQRARYTYRLRGPDALDFRIELSQDGETWTGFMEGRYARA